MGCGICKFHTVIPEPSACIEPSSFHRYYEISSEDSFNRPTLQPSNPAPKLTSKNVPKSVPKPEKERVLVRSNSEISKHSDVDGRAEMTKLIQDLLRSYYQSIDTSPMTRAQCEVLDRLLGLLGNSELSDEQYVLFLNDMKDEFLRLLTVAIPQQTTDNISDSFDLQEPKPELNSPLKSEIRTAQTTPVGSTSSKSTQRRVPERHRSFIIAQELLSILC